MKFVYKLSGIISLFSIILFSYFYFSGKSQLSGPFLIFTFVSLAIAVRGSEKLKGFSYSLLILTAVTASMYYPQYFLNYGEFEYQSLIVPLLQIIMFGMGSQMSLNDFKGVMKMPKGVIVGVICQFTLMPILGISIATLFKFPPEVAAGIVLVGSSPSGMASNVMSFIAKANLALSVTLTAFATLLSPIMTPLLMQLLAGELVEIHFWEMMYGIFNMVILPICAGLVFNLFAFAYKNKKNTIIQIASYLLIILLKNLIDYNTNGLDFNSFATGFSIDVLIFILLPIVGVYIFKFFIKGGKESLNQALSFVSMLGIGIIITIITAAGRDSLLEVGLLLILACCIHNLLGYSLGYSLSKLLKMKEKDCRTVALEVGMQNGGMASGLALQMGKIATVGLAPAIFGPLMNITGSSLASWWRNREPEKVEGDE
ncbi:bile acid:sodium symporter family protein [Labilibacter marinus]|uniref:bile acid:sodium symporter family protein n=1 Tax=Labilibacter marinus TaxID=1477105 RepID=UPI0009FB21FA|nr:bile acid:sodium symporter family protein [Labilibacter marinus]